MPAALRQSRVIDDPLQSLLARDRAVVESTPDCFATAPRKSLLLKLAEERFIRIRRLMNRAVFANHVRHAGIDEQPRAVAVVAGDVADLVDLAALGAADRGRARGIKLVA